MGAAFESIGFDAWDTARDSFRNCPRCSARAKVLHVEPHSGGGPDQHLHRCTRCRHEWESAIEDDETCPYDNCCGGEYLDAMGLNRLRDIRQSYLRARDALGLPGDFRPLKDKLKIIRIAELLRGILGDDTAGILAWMEKYNTVLCCQPREIAGSSCGLDRIRGYLEARSMSCR